MNRDSSLVITQEFNLNLLEAAPASIEIREAELGNPNLPIYARKQEIIDTFQTNAITILVAKTGAGKSTQVPQYALEAGFDTVYLTQPRRRAAMNVAERVQAELGDVLGEARAAELVSHQTGAGLEGPRDARIKVVTDGLHLNREGRDLSDRHNELWIIDEVHEWNENLEMLVALGKQRHAENPNFKMLIMSATMDKDRLAEYLADEQGVQPPIIEVEGSMYDVEYREEALSTVAKETFKAAEAIAKNPDAYAGANTIQVFVAGKGEITDTIDKLRSTLPAELLQQTSLIPLDAKMMPHDQAPAYEDINGIKIVVQTKIGQTSMTIPRTRYVISSGLERRPEMDEEGTSALMLGLISQDDIDQQMGRTGRTSEGIFILTKMDERQSFVSRGNREPHQTPEILRSNIDRWTLFLATIGQNIRQFDTYHDVEPVSIERSLRRVIALGAMDADGAVTAIGRRMSELPLGLPMGRSVVHAERHFSAVSGYMAAIAAAKEVGGLRLFERGGTRRWKALSDEASSDHLAQLDIFIAIQDMKAEDMHTYDLDVNNVIRAREHYLKVAKRLGSDPYKPLLPPTLEERMMLRECLAAGSINSVYLPAGEGLYRHLGESVVPREISNRSVALGSRMAVVGEPRNVQIVRRGNAEIKHIIEDVTEITVADIGRLATHLTRWKPMGFTLRGGRFMQVEQQLLDTIVLSSREVVAEPSPILRAAIIEHVKVSPGNNLTELYRIKRSIEKLAHKAKGQVSRLTEDMINAYIYAAAPDDVTDPSLIENNLRLMIEAENITLDKFVSAEQRAHIMDNAPSAKTINDVSFGLRYVNGKAVVKRFNLDMIQRLGDDVSTISLDDGRELYFYHNDKHYTFRQLKKVLQNEGLL